jgi:membrane-bound lytic murein transglycosylase D
MNQMKLLVICLAALVSSPVFAKDATALEASTATAVGTSSAGHPAAALAPAGSAADDEEATAQAGEEDADAPDEPAIAEEVKAESAELEQVRAAEEKARVAEPMLIDDPAARAASRLGLESPLRLRLRDAFGREVGPAPAESTGRIAGLPEIDHDLRHLQAEYDIPVEVNEQVIRYVRFFQAPQVRPHFVKWLGRSYKYIPTFRRILREEGLPEDTVYLAMIESGFANHATSRARAVGPWQFIPPTGKRMGLKQDFWLDERRDPEKAAHAAARYLRDLNRQMGDWRLAWASYNAGPGKIVKAKRKGQLDFWAMTRGRVLKAETKGYVPKLMAAAIVAKHPEAFGFGKDEVQQEAWAEYEQVTIPRATALAAVAKAAEVPEKALLDLNPELRRTCTPPRPYTIKVPKGQGEVFASNWPAVSEEAGHLAFAQHRVAPGESMKAIAARYQTPMATLFRLNGLKQGRHVKAGTELVIPTNALARTQAVAFAAAEPPPPPEKSRSRRSRGKVVLARADGSQRASKAVEVGGKSRSHVAVRSGDTLWSIAQRFGVAVDEICRWNGIRNARSFKLQVGRQLVVYPRRVSAAVAGRRTPKAG